MGRRSRPQAASPAQLHRAPVERRAVPQRADPACRARAPSPRGGRLPASDHPPGPLRAGPRGRRGRRTRLIGAGRSAGSGPPGVQGPRRSYGSPESGQSPTNVRLRPPEEPSRESDDDPDWWGHQAALSLPNIVPEGSSMSYTQVPDTPVAATILAMTAASLERCDLSDREIDASPASRPSRPSVALPSPMHRTRSGGWQRPDARGRPGHPGRGPARGRGGPHDRGSRRHRRGPGSRDRVGRAGRGRRRRLSRSACAPAG